MNHMLRCRTGAAGANRIIVWKLPILLGGMLAMTLACHLCWGGLVLAGEPEVLNLWPEKPPGETQELPPEADQSGDTGREVAGKRVIRLGNVSTPQIAIYRPKGVRDTGTSVVICPGGGHSILAYDLEGTEVAQWLNTLGVTGVVLKYRVPARPGEHRWRAAVQDAQRAVSLVRANAAQWKLDPKRIGICGFSAGGETAALTALFEERTYEAVDAADKQSTQPNFGMLIYPAYLVEKDTPQLRSYVKVTKNTPPLFFVHAFDDRVTPLSSLLLASAVKQAGGSAEVHVYATGGHGYGLRPTQEAITHWPERAGGWLKDQGLLNTSE